MVNGLKCKKANIDLHKLEARFYDQVHFEIFNEAEQRYIVENISKLLEGIKMRNCLDMGCGTGNITTKEHEFFHYGGVVGLDLSKRMLMQLRGRTESRNLSLIFCHSKTMHSISFQCTLLFIIFRTLSWP